MIFRQMFDRTSSTYTYLIAGRAGGEALLIDPVLDHVDRYIELLDQLDLKLVKALDTHVHADHITGLGALRDRTRCVTVMGAESAVDVVSMRIGDGDAIDIEGVRLEAMHTPGHTADSYCFRMADRVFTGDTLFIRGTGRTDFQGGSAAAQYHSIFEKLLTLPDATFIYPGHDYKGDTVSTIAEERAFNPRLQVASAAEYVAIMDALDLPDPKMMDVAVPANLHIGMADAADPTRPGCCDVAEARALLGRADTVFVDLRETGERERDGIIEGALHVPYNDLDAALAPGGALHYALASGDRRLLLYCAFGERSALALDTVRDAGVRDLGHLAGGIDAWKQAGAPVVSA